MAMDVSLFFKLDEKFPSSSKGFQIFEGGKSDYDGFFSGFRTGMVLTGSDIYEVSQKENSSTKSVVFGAPLDKRNLTKSNVDAKVGDFYTENMGIPVVYLEASNPTIGYPTCRINFKGDELYQDGRKLRLNYLKFGYEAMESHDYRAVWKDGDSEFHLSFRVKRLVDDDSAKRKVFVVTITDLVSP